MLRVCVNIPCSGIVVPTCLSPSHDQVRVPKSAGINDTIMPNTTGLMYGNFGIRAMTGKRVAANTIEACRR